MSTAQKLMDLAEFHIRDGGYRGFSFRELAAEMGIKSASVHHHFATKDTMTAAVARRYAERFLTAVASQANDKDDDVVAVYRNAFRDAFHRDGRMCLFGVLGVESGVLSPEIADVIRSFFRGCIEDLSRRMGGPESVTRAFHIMAALEGGMMLARAYDDIEAFDRATAGLVSAKSSSVVPQSL
jgi:TetR/AcrR family transcriptional repressor of nem operon